MSTNGNTTTTIEDDTVQEVNDVDNVINYIDNDLLFISITTLEKLFNDVTPIEQIEEQLVAQIDYSNEYKIVYNYFRAIVSLVSLKTISLDTTNTNTNTNTYNNYNNSIRILHLTSLCLKLNPANYTVWHLRRQCLNSIYYNNVNNNSPIGSTTGSTVEETTSSMTTINNDGNTTFTTSTIQIASQDFTFIKKEMKLVSLLGGDNPKNYQIWYHRRALLEQLENYIITITSSIGSSKNTTNIDRNTDQLIQYFSNDLQYIETVIELDGKNYHAWTHRQWTICSLVRIYQHLYNQNDTTKANEVWINELHYCNTVILNDVRNNSGWNQRWFTFHHGCCVSGSSSSSSSSSGSFVLTVQDYTIEADYAFDIASIDPYNESPWRYLIAIIKEQIELVVTTQQQRQEKIQQQVQQEPYTTLLNYLQKIHTIESNFNNDYPRDDIDYRIPNLTSAVIDIMELIDDYSTITITTNSTTEIIQPQREEEDNNNNNDNVKENISSFLEEAIELAIALQTKYDTIRRNYWKLRIMKLQQRQQQRESRLQQVLEDNNQ